MILQHVQYDFDKFRVSSHVSDHIHRFLVQPPSATWWTFQALDNAHMAVALVALVALAFRNAML